MTAVDNALKARVCKSLAVGAEGLAAALRGLLGRDDAATVIGGAA